ncbi:UNVERIFIED_CONTAM: hypothetical protein RMT77_000976 [Armadillidium vulgare]
MTDSKAALKKSNPSPKTQSYPTSLEIGGSNPVNENAGQNDRSNSPPQEENQPNNSPSPRFRHCSGSTTPTRTPSPSFGGEGEDRQQVKTKTVSFHSHTNWKKDRKIHSAHDCLEYMIEGSSLIKLRSNGRQYHRYFRLLEDLSAIRWTPTSKKSCRAQGKFILMFFNERLGWNI